MLFALGTPVAFAALVVSFLLGLALRAVAVRLTARALGLADRREPIAPRPREDIDPFGAVGAAIGGVGWGRMLTVDDVPRHRGRGRAAVVFLAGPLTCVFIGEALLGIYAVSYPGDLLAYLGPADVLLGIDLPFSQQVLLSIAVGLLCFGLLELIPIPPLDGFGVMYNAVRRPGASLAWMRLWFEEKNIGTVILVACCLFPIPGPILLRVIDALGLFFMRLWG